MTTSDPKGLQSFDTTTQHWIGIHYNDWLEKAYFENDRIESPDSELLTTAFVITQATSPFKVVKMNHRASQLGIRPDMNLASAEALVPTLISTVFDSAKEEKALFERTAAWQAITPYVHIVMPNIILLNVTSCLELWKGKAHLIDHVITQAQTLSTYVPVSMNWGFTPLSVIAYLNSCASLYQHAFQQPKDRIQIQQSSLEQTHTIPIAFLPFDPSNVLCAKDLEKTRAKIIQMGIHTIGDLFNIPKNELATAFKPEFIHYLERFCGDRLDPQPRLETQHYFETRLTIEGGATIEAQICTYFKQALETLQSELNDHQLATKLVTVTLIDDAQKCYTFDIGSRKAHHQLDAFNHLLALQLSRQDIADSILELHVELPKLTPANQEPNSLFPESVLKRSASLKARLFDRLHHRLGEDAIHEVTASHHQTPELSWNKITSDVTTTEQKNYPLLHRRPHFLYEEPISIETRAELPFYQETLTILSGPEIIDIAAWLQPQTRHYYIAFGTKNERYWIYQTSDRSWYIHGVFS